MPRGLRTTAKQARTSPKPTAPTVAMSPFRGTSPTAERPRPPSTAPVPTAAIRKPSPDASRWSASRASAGRRMMYGKPNTLITVARRSDGPITGCRAAYPSPSRSARRTGGGATAGRWGTRTRARTSVMTRKPAAFSEKQPAGPMAP